MQLDKKLIGHKFNAFTTTVEAGKIRLFCKAIGEEDPIYVDEEAAKKAGYRAIPAPPRLWVMPMRGSLSCRAPARPWNCRYIS